MCGNLGFVLWRNFGVVLGVCGNLKGLFECVKTSVCGAVGNLESAFWGIWKLRGGRFRSVETWHSCTLETFGVHSCFA